MARRALILNAGILLTIVTSAQPAAAISPQSTVTNNQSQLANVIVDQTLNVVDVWTATTMTTAAAGNTFGGSAVGVDLSVQSTQALTADVTANSRLNVDGSSGLQTVQTTAATGNDGESNIYSGSALTATSTQTVGAVNITSLNEYNGGAGETSSLTNSTQAVANSQGYGVSGDSTATYTVNQSSAAITQADGGGTLGYTDGTAVFSALATSNNVTGTGVNGATQTANVTQTMTGQRTQSSVYANVGTGQDLVGQATTTANNVTINNETGPLNVVVAQDNSGYVQSQAVLTAYEFGTAQANAYGVGNSVMAGEVGTSLTLDNTQTNSGDGVVVQSSFTGGGGYDAFVASTAIGNAVTGYTCTSCGGQMTVANRQTNSAEVGASSTVSIAGYNRTTAATATATGNAASFYVSTPSGN